MQTILMKILNMSISASVLILVVLVARLILKKASKWISCVLWALVALRLMIPFSLESSFSLLPSGEVITYKSVPSESKTETPDPIGSVADTEIEPNTPSVKEDPRIVESRVPVIDSGIKPVDNALNPILEKAYNTENRAPEVTSPKAKRSVDWALVVGIVWLTGIAGCLVFALVSYLRIRKKVSASVPLGDGVWEADEIKTPFILGLVRPRIYVPESLQGEALGHVLAHERAHLKRLDHWWKVLGYLLLSVYWFNPLCWLAYVLLCRDIESACDEKAIREMNREEVAAYSETLLDLSAPKSRICACPLAFGEANVKQRIKQVLSFKKPALAVIILALLVCVIVGGCFLTDPKRTEAPTEPATETPTEKPTEKATEKLTEKPTERSTEQPTEAPTEVPTEASTEAPTETASEQPTEPSTEPEFGAGSLDPVKFEARKEEFINSLRGHGYNPPSIEDDLARAMEEYGLFNSTLYVADLDLSAFHYLTFSETVLKDAAFTRECRIELAERMGSFFPYVETYLQYNKIEYRGDRVYMDLQVWFLIEYARPGASVSDIMTVGIDHQVVLQRQDGGTFLLASDSFDETSVGRAHSSDR